MKYHAESDIENKIRIIGKPDPFKNSAYQNAVWQCRTKIIKILKFMELNVDYCNAIC